MNILSYSVVFLLTVSTILILRPVAFQFDLLDVPNDRKTHHGKVPLIGGISMFIGITLGFSLNGDNNLDNSYFSFILSSFILIIIGVIDDYKNMSTKIRFFFQIIAALIIIYWGDIYLEDLGNLISSEKLQLGYFASIFSVFCILGVLNSLNFSDGIDGLSASLSLVTFSSLAFFIAQVNNIVALNFVLCFIFAIFAFLIFNVFLGKQSRFKIFMGDAGSTFLGLGIAYSLISFSQPSNSFFSPVTALWLYSIPLLDTASIMIRRILNGKSPFSADREHLHHYFILQGWSDRKTLCFIIFLSIIMAVIGIIFEVCNIQERLVFLLFITIAFAYYFIINNAWKKALLV